MPTPFPSRETAYSSWTDGAATQPSTFRCSEWRCSRCDKLLGLISKTRIHLRFARGHEYLAGLPVTATCRGCGTLNEFSVPRGVALSGEAASH